MIERNGSSDGTGPVGAIWRYPVKSMSGEELNEADVVEGGLLGDRVYALADPSNGRVASAKHPRKWGPLLEFRASLTEPPVPDRPMPTARITLPDGRVVTGDQDNVDTVLSGELGRSVTLTATRPESPSVERMDPFDPEAIMDIGPFMMKGRFSDYAALHVLTTATLDRLRELYPQGRFEPRRFRPNIVIESPLDRPDFVENAWVGRTLAIGGEVRLRITDPCPRCSIPTLGQGDLPGDPGILRTVAEHNTVPVPVLDGENLPSAGVYAFVIRGGRVHRGDRVRLE